jgi:hypothetical protein
MAEMATPAVDTATEPIKPAATGAPETEPTSWMSGTGEFRDGTPEAIRTLLDNKKWTTVEQLANGYSELEKFKGGGQHLTIPEADDAEGWATVYKSLGRPDEATGYEYAAEEGTPIDDALMTEFKTFAHERGFNQKQFKEIVDFQIDSIMAQQEVYDKQLAEKAESDSARMKQMYGINYDQAMADADMVADKHGFKAELEAEGIYNIPVVKQLLNQIANMEAEDKIPTDQNVPERKTPQQRLEEIKKSEAFTSKFHPDHAKIMVEFMEINRQIANAGQARPSR